MAMPSRSSKRTPGIRGFLITSERIGASTAAPAMTASDPAEVLKSSTARASSPSLPWRVKLGDG